jgi:hypothetical protein
MVPHPDSKVNIFHIILKKKKKKKKTYYGGEPQELPHPNEHHSSIATLSQEQQPTASDMATQTATVTAATTTV